MIRITDKAACCGCGACANACPKKCIEMKSDNEGFLYPQVDEKNCVDCGLCEKVCPVKASGLPREDKPQAFAAKAKDKDVVAHSSSGGILTVLAEKIIQSGGAVYGCATGKGRKSARHIRVTSVEDLSILRGSKYIQSATGETFAQVKKDLDAGLSVLFSGVPCQINGLRAYLQKDFEKLYCVETVCHGVPSEKLWRKYTGALEKKYGAVLANVDFRCKKAPDKKPGEIEIFKSVNDDPYMALYLKNVALRPSCYDCPAKKQEKKADLTLGDLWGGSQLAPEFGAGGASLVFVHSEKGRELWKAAGVGAEVKEISFDAAVKHNPSYDRSPQKPKGREGFYEDADKLDFPKLYKKYCPQSAKTKFKKTVKKLLSALKGGKQSAGGAGYGVRLTLKK